jgi:hypothetical protein
MMDVLVRRERTGCALHARRSGGDPAIAAESRTAARRISR